MGMAQIGLLVAALTTAGTAERLPGKVDFSRDIRPILTNNCFKCHGPDPKARKSGLRLDTAAGATRKNKKGVAAIIPGNLSGSELIRRITAADPDDRMPPAEAGVTLDEREIDLFRRWIAEGADYEAHWAFVKPARPALPALPAVGRKDWPRNPVDRFILARLDSEGLTPSPEADRHALARRVSLDLTGLPPSIDDVDRFVGDRDPRAYELLVDRLLKSSAYGEHWARAWLDLARYADSAGYADDPPRTIWGFRDWVIRAINDNRPFDRFTIEQIAGDLLKDPTPD